MWEVSPLKSSDFHKQNGSLISTLTFRHLEICDVKEMSNECDDDEEAGCDRSLSGEKAENNASASTMPPTSFLYPCQGDLVPTSHIPKLSRWGPFSRAV